eukprot:UN01578
MDIVPVQGNAFSSVLKKGAHKQARPFLPNVYIARQGAHIHLAHTCAPAGLYIKIRSKRLNPGKS